ncbi:hypothetical protein Q4575_09450 [Psychrosphaera sp. 1_MG-2023]|uniref:hypothetical protein n=1 Tax=Psychrosphaera sp. 1_MG-2023 TaxID=3062643 RepID=UPI0026E1A478|nr:hypothetical protein [Psychrosphaera sp. 1_MG-2023]MDO6719626.1 hypothetical protein [Psychrosphaera sp. 1_MG-2023]
MSNPDFSDYSLDELLDAQCHIDAEKFPDRVKQIQTAIAAILRQKTGQQILLSGTHSL